MQSPSQYGGYNPRLVTEWVRVRIPIIICNRKKSLAHYDEKITGAVSPAQNPEETETSSRKRCSAAILKLILPSSMARQPKVGLNLLK
ncbi:hypothetical protein TNCV_1841441 [Trichonephila clavipes]|nr:hypothetical protein TNCV_1841441 [Trichonephila clavipes]